LTPIPEIPARDLLPARQERLASYIYSDAAIKSLTAAAGRLAPPLRATTSDRPNIRRYWC